jgi:hypothetical protein
MHRIVNWGWLIVLSVLLPGAGLAQQAGSPKTISFDGAALTDAKRQAASGDRQAQRLIQRVVKDAEKAMDLPNFTVTDKPQPPPSGDKHDYMSLSPYWWPDPAKPDGKPYLRKDGQVNPEREKYDQPKLDKLTEAAGDLALAYYLKGDEKYAQKASQLIRVWFLDDATRMNPNCRYAQVVRGQDEVRQYGVIETVRMRRVLDADALLNGSTHWSDADHQKLKAWFKEYLDYLLTSEQGRKEHDSPNNHGSWYAVQTASYAMYLGDESTARQLVAGQGRKFISTQIDPDGRQPLEMERTKAFDYSRFNLEALGNLAMFGQQLGVDLWNFKTEDGRSLRAALDWFAPYASGEKKWEGQQIVDPKMAEAMRVYRWAANAYNEPKYERVAQAIRSRAGAGRERVDLLWPARAPSQ